MLCRMQKAVLLLHYINHLAEAFIMHICREKKQVYTETNNVSNATILKIKSKPEQYKPRADVCVQKREKQEKKK